MAHWSSRRCGRTARGHLCNESGAGRTATALAAIGGGTASAEPFGGPFPDAHPNRSAPVFVQSDNPAGNQVVVYDRAGNGTLSQAGVYNTGGRGGVLAGSVVDHLASQGSLVYDQDAGERSGTARDRPPRRATGSSGSSPPVLVRRSAWLSEPTMRLPWIALIIEESASSEMKSRLPSRRCRLSVNQQARNANRPVDRT